LQNQTHENTEGVAMAMAMAGGGAILPSDKSYSVSANVGFFENQSAMAFGGVARLVNDVFVNGGVGVGTTEGTVGGRVGAAYAW
jgi:hypothetical protein